MYSQIYTKNLMNNNIFQNIKEKYNQWNINKNNLNEFTLVDNLKDIYVKFKEIEIFDYGIRDFIKINYLYLKQEGKISTYPIYNINQLNLLLS
tara:strand:- start:284 stop:562 length:279 start_codon:yes stop_codon:yes gene_type:complete